MNTFTEYLIQRGLQQSTINDIQYRLEKYKKWCKRQRYHPQTIEYKAILRYIKYLKSKKHQPITINNQLHRIKIYFDYLIEQHIRTDNPLEDVKVRGEKRKILSNILSEEELEDLYYSFETENVNNDVYHKACAKRNKVITGLIVYQALDKTTLAALKLEHVQPYKGKIYVPSTGDNKSRTLELKPWQVIELLEYINEVRSMIQKRTSTNDDQLFPIKANFNTILFKITKLLKTYNAKVVNASHVRTSVICNWMKRHNIREVQQMCGHKYIGSTEKYKQDSLENLKEAIDKFHPLS